MKKKIAIEISLTTFIVIAVMIVSSCYASNKTVFVSKYGTVYHTKKNCSKIKNSQNVKEIKLKDIKKIEECKECSK